MRSIWLLGVVAATACSRAPPVVFRKVDAHVHVGPDGASQLYRVMAEQGIDAVVNLSGGWPGMGLMESVEMARQAGGKMVVFCAPPFQLASRGGDWPGALVSQLHRAHAMGCRGVKIFKSLGLMVHREDGRLLEVDAPELDGLFDAAADLGMPVAMHTGDPVAFWEPVTPDNERFAELRLNPGWSYAGKPVPSWEQLFHAYERRVARHPRTTFIGVHFGNAPEDPGRVAAMLERFPNLYVDTAARIPELGRRGRAEAVRALVLRFPGRVLFGTDLGVGPGGTEGLVLGAPGAAPTTPADVARFFGSTWRFFESSARGFPGPTPIQGGWTIDGLGLPAEVLRDVYAGNILRLLEGRAQDSPGTPPPAAPAR